MQKDVTDICFKNNINDDDLNQICKRYLAREGFDCQNFYITAIKFDDFSVKPHGFLGYHLKLTLTVSSKSVCDVDDRFGTHSGGGEDVETSFFVKLLPMQNERQANYVEGMRVFEKETQLYQHLIPRLHGIALDVRDWAAHSYLSKDDKVLIVEDLKRLGFGIPPNCKQGLFDLDHFLVATSAIARFHASSIILEAKCKEKIPQMYPNCLYETAYPEDPDCIRMIGLRNAIEALTALAKRIPKYRDDSTILPIILDRLPREIGKIIEFVRPSAKYRNILLHGDLWSNNMLFSYDDTEQARPTDCRLVDFQLARYAPPALDLVSFVYLCTTEELRSRHLDDIYDHYYRSLASALSPSDLSIEDELPKHEFYESIEFYQLAGMIEACLFSHLIVMPEKVFDQMFADSETYGHFIESAEHRSRICVENFDEDLGYRQRMTDLLSQLIDEFIVKVV